MTETRLQRAHSRALSLRLSIPALLLIVSALIVAAFSPSVRARIPDGARTPLVSTLGAARTQSEIDLTTHLAPIRTTLASSTLRPDVHDAHGSASSGPGQIPGAPDTHVHTRPSIDGKTAPELIPDNVAFKLFVRMALPPSDNPKAIQRQRTYIGHVLRVGAQANGRTDGPSGAEIDAVLTYLRSHEASLRQLEGEASRVTAAGDAIAKSDVDRRQTSLMQSIADDLNMRLPDDTATKVMRYVNGHFKKNVKIVY